MSALEIFLYAASVAAGLGFLLTPWGAPVLSFVIGTKVGRWLGGAAAAAWLVFVAVSSIYRKGQRAGKATALDGVRKANEKAVESRRAIERQVEATPDRKLRDELKRWAPMVLLAITLGGCATVPTGGSAGGAFCDVAKPFKFSGPTVDAMTSDEVEAVVTHQRFGAQHCGWTP